MHFVKDLELTIVGEKHTALIDCTVIKSLYKFN